MGFCWFPYIIDGSDKGLCKVRQKPDPREEELVIAVYTWKHNITNHWLGGYDMKEGINPVTCKYERKNVYSVVVNLFSL